MRGGPAASKTGRHRPFGEELMRHLKSAACTALVALALGAAAPAQAETVKVGVILHYSGPFASLGAVMDNAVKLWVKEHGDKVGGNTIELIRRDTGGPNPEVAKRLAQELIARDGVKMLTGFVLTPEPLAVAPLVTEAKVPLVIMNAATSMITTASPYITRVSLTLPQTTMIFGHWAATKGGLKDVMTSVADYGPGYDAEEYFKIGFTEAGGTIKGSVRIPLVNPDFVPFLQRMLDQKPQGIYAFIPGGTQPVAYLKAFNDVGLKKAGIKLMPSAEVVDEQTINTLGDEAVGLITSTHYTSGRKSDANKKFLDAWHKEYGADKDPDLFAVGAYDAMALIYDVVQKLNGKVDGDKAMDVIKGWTHESPRGPIRIDPETRDIIQNVYICKTERVAGRLENVVMETYEGVKDPGKQRKK
jgi:branched-chain amino acid transport system substrate-binding protein